MGSPPPHRHDGRSPLPLGMDASRPPAVWKGRHSVWPHEPRSGWSFCVTIPSWTTPPPSRMAGQDSTPIVFYRVHVGVQSPQGISNLRPTLRRFSDFMKLHAALKRLFPRKRLPTPPPKNALLRVSSNRSAVEERKRLLEEWMASLLDDIEVARSAPMAAFLELDAAARAAILAVEQDMAAAIAEDAPSDVRAEAIVTNERRVASIESSILRSREGLEGDSESSHTSGGFVVSDSYGSEADGRQPGESDREEADIRAGGKEVDVEMKQILRERYEGEETVESRTAVENLSEGEKQPAESSVSPMRMGEWLNDNSLWEDSKSEVDIGKSLSESSGANLALERDAGGNNAETGSAEGLGKNAISLGEPLEVQRGLRRVNVMTPSTDGFVSEPNSALRSEQAFSAWGGTGPSNSPSSSTRGSEVGDGALFGPRGEGVQVGKAEHLEEGSLLGGVRLILPSDQRAIVKKNIGALRRRLTTAMADMEELVARLGQETAVREFLASKVKELEGDLDRERRKGQEALEVAALTEHERVTELKWDVEEARTAMLSAQEALDRSQAAREEVEDQLKESEAARAALEAELLRSKETQDEAVKRQDAAEGQARADKKVLVKEVKTLRSTISELQDAANAAVKDRDELQAQLTAERERSKRQRMQRAKLMHEVLALRRRLSECSVEQLAREEAPQAGAREDVVELLGTSDARIGLLMAEAQLLVQDEGEESDSEPFRNNLPRGAWANGSPSEGSASKVEGAEQKVVFGGVGEAGEESEADFREAARYGGGGSRESLKGSETEMRRLVADILTDNAQLRKAVNSLTRQAVLMASQADVPPRKSALNRFL